MYRSSRILGIFEYLEIIITILLTCLTQEGSSHFEIATGYPAMSMNYKMYVDAGKEVCVFQYADSGAVFEVNFFVIRGGDLKANFAIKDPQGVWVLPYEYGTKATFKTVKAVRGHYAICTENNSYSHKLIGYFMVTYEAEGWERFINDLRSIDVDAKNATNTFRALSEGVNEMGRLLHESRSLEARDYALLAENYYRIGFWSSVQFCIILVSGITQVYIIRQFFKETSPHGKYKMRL